MEPQKKSYKGINGLMPSGKISEEYVTSTVKYLSGTEGAMGLSDGQLRKKIIRDIKMSKKIADGEGAGRKNNKAGGIQRKKASTGRMMYKDGGMLKAKPC